MPVIKIHLEDEEFAPICRMADHLRLHPEDIAYAALNRLMLRSTEAEIRDDVAHTHSWRGSSLPQWSDSAHGVHAYECREDTHSSPCR